jgi:protein-disulfide isomerase
MGSAAFLGLGVALARLPFGLVSEALAQGPSVEELMKPGPLGDQAQGAENAPVTIIEYASMTCSHCASFHLNTYPELKKRYIDTGKVRYILREFPLDPLANGAFVLARCAGDEKYFQVVDALFKAQKSWAFVRNPIPPLFNVMRKFGFNEQSFEKCLSDEKLIKGVDAVRQRGAERFGIDSTPTFFINGKVLRGALTIDQIEAEVQPLLKS